MTNCFLVSKFLAPWEGGNIVGQQLPALLDVICYVLSRSWLSKREHCPQRADSKHMFVSHCHVFMSINNKKPEAEAHVRLHTLSHVVGCCWELLRKVLTRSNFWVNNSPNFFKFVPWSPKLSATMLTFALLFLHRWGHACALHLVSKVLWVVSFPRCTACPNIVRSCCIRLHITANIDATTPIIVGPPMLGVVWSICK